MRQDLKIFRVKQHLTQQQLAEQMGVSVATYNLIENGTRRGSQKFWEKLQQTFKLEDGEVWKMQKNII